MLASLRIAALLRQALMLLAMQSSAVKHALMTHPAHIVTPHIHNGGMLAKYLLVVPHAEPLLWCRYSRCKSLKPNSILLQLSCMTLPRSYQQLSLAQSNCTSAQRQAACMEAVPAACSTDVVQKCPA